ncbi:hypothetical protein JXA32_13040 [Candidatus Sumerlaeota bacterium]|nr:hypothetical protein [Candidatus Sumerlaeota bacterium]
MVRELNGDAKDFQPDFISGRERMYTVHQAARRLDCSPTTVRSLIHLRRLGYLLKTGFERKVYHIPASAIRAYENLREAERALERERQANARLNRELQRLRDQLGEEENVRQRESRSKPPSGSSS